MKPQKRHSPKEGRLVGKEPEKQSPGANASVDSRNVMRELRPSRTSETQLVKIEKPVYGGAFLARVAGKAIFVPLTLPGEQARVRITQRKPGYDSAEPVEIVIPSANRIVPSCPHFGPCGGCHYQHANYETQLTFKEAILRETLERGGVQAPDEIATLAAEPWHYRNRIRLAFDASGNPGYRSRRSNVVIPISQCPIAAPMLLAVARAAAELIERVPANLRPAELSVFSDPDESALLVTFFVPDNAGARLESLAESLRERIPALVGAELASGGRPGHPPRTLARWGATSLNYRAAGSDYRVDHGAFFQVNRWLIDALVERVTAGHEGKLAWDLFAGVGLFARKLIASFERVVAVESSPAARAALEHNLWDTTGKAVNDETLLFLRSSRAKERPDLIVVDPPRTGLGAEIAAPALVYVSCDPATLARDLRALMGSGYAIHSITLADLFPQTFHLETVVQLRRA